ncbi:hypothetical protein ABTD93_20170, partial [Acinetobacter baumannii]
HRHPGLRPRVRCSPASGGRAGPRPWVVCAAGWPRVVAERSGVPRSDPAQFLVVSNARAGNAAGNRPCAGIHSHSGQHRPRLLVRKPGQTRS